VGRATVVVLVSIVVVAMIAAMAWTSSGADGVSASSSSSSEAGGLALPASNAAGQDLIIPSAEDCRALLSTASLPTTAPGSPDPVKLIEDGTLVQLPGQLRDPIVASTPVEWGTIDSYLAGTPVPSPDSWDRAMTIDGFKVAAAVGYTAGPDEFGAEALTFASPAAALDFQQRSLGFLCDLHVIDEIRPIEGAPGGFAFVRPGAGPRFRASIVAGSSVVHVNLCRCVELPDLLGAATTWAQAIAKQLGVS
jgi:hypothetical protein